MQLGTNCAANDTQSVVCSVNSGSSTLIRALKMKTTYANGTSTVESFAPSTNGRFASYFGVLPAGAIREFSCDLTWNIIVDPGRIGGVLTRVP